MRFIKTLLIALSICVLSSCTDPVNATRVLSQNGYSDIRITGYSWFTCSEDDTYSTGFVAKSPSGQTVEGCVCSGMLFKNSTIRFK